MDKDKKNKKPTMPKACAFAKNTLFIGLSAYAHGYCGL